MPKPRVPSKLKIIRGTDQPCRMLANEVDYEAIKDITSPDILDSDGKKEWDRILPLLKSKQLATQADISSLVMYCYIWSRLYKVMVKSKEAPVLFLKDGTAMEDPYHKIISRLYPIYRSLSNMFGFSPADRTRINTPQGASKPTLEDSFIKRAV